MHRGYNEAWYVNQRYLLECHRVADKLVHKYPRHSIYSLGQSPAWIIKAIGMGHTHVRTGYIPFSGNIFSRELNHSSDISSFMNADRPLHEKKYRKVLTDLNLNPQKIIQHANNGEKTVIVEYTELYRGLRSFLSVLALWAIELGCLDRLKESLIICVLPRTYTNALSQIEFFIEQSRVSFAIANIEVDGYILGHIGRGIDVGPLADRLVPYYSADEWNKPPILSTEHAATLAKIESLLRGTMPSEDKANFKCQPPVIFTNYLSGSNEQTSWKDYMGQSGTTSSLSTNNNAKKF